MKKTLLTIVLTIALTLTMTTANANIIIQPPGEEPESSGGGGGSSTPSEGYQSIDLGDNFRMWASYYNNGNAHYSANTQLGQGFMNKDWASTRLSQHLYRDPEDPTNIYVSMGTSFTETIYGAGENPYFDEMSQSFNINLPRLNIHVSSSITNEVEVIEDNTSWTGIIINHYASVRHTAWIENANIFDMQLGLSYWDEELYTDYSFRAHLYGDYNIVKAYTSGLEIAPDSLVASYQPIPEPITITLLGVGAIALLRRRR